MTKKPFKVLSTTAMAAALMTSALVPAAVFAAEDNVAQTVSDYILEQDGNFFSIDVTTYGEMRLGGVALAPVKFVKSADNKVYNLDDYLAAKLSNIGGTMEDALGVLAADPSSEVKDVAYGSVEIGEDGKPNYKPAPSIDLKVESVSAITTTMDVTGGQLKFAINGETEAADVAALEEAGYSVDFVVSGAATADSATGVVSSITPGSKTFRYQVKVTDAAGEAVAESELVTVTVKDYSTTVTELNNVTLSVGGNKVTVNTVSKTDTGIKVDAFGKLKATTGTEDVNLSNNAGVTFTTSKNAIATVDTNGNVTLTGAVGEVTITAKAGNLTKSVTFKVVADVRDVDTTKSAVSATAIKDAEGAAVEFTVTLKDQYGEVITGGASSIAFVKEDVVSSTVTEDTDNKGTYKVKATLDKKTTTAQDVDVTYAGTKLSTIKVTVVEPGDVASYALSAESTKLDLFDDEKSSTTLNVVGKDANGYTVLTVSQEDLTDATKYSVKPTDKTIVAFEDGVLVGKKVGTTTVKVYSLDGDIEDSIGEVTIEVINSKPTLATATIAPIAKQTDVTKTIALADVVTATLAGSGDYEDVDFTFTSNEVIAGEYGTVGYVYITGTTAAGITEDGNIVFTAQDEAVEATTELTITDLKGNILAEITFLLDIDEDEEGE